MRLTRFLNEGDDIQKGLSVNEPEIDGDYSKDEIKDNISIIKTALDAQERKGTETEADKSIIKDLQDKLDKWENIKSETKPAGPHIPAVDILAAQPPEEAPPEEAPEKEAPEEEPEKAPPEEDDPKGQKDAEDKAKKKRKK